MASSYDTVAGLLMRTSDFDALREKARTALKEAEVAKYEFELGSGDGGTEVLGFFRASVAGQVLSRRTAERDVQGFWINWSEVLSEDELKTVVHSHFGTERCRTYNCKLDKVLDKFPSQVWRKLSEDMDAELKRAQERIKRQMMKHLESSEMARDRQEFRNRIAIEGIKAAIRKFPVTKEVLKQALDEYIVHEILEC